LNVAARRSARRQRLATERRKEEALVAALDQGLASGRVAPGVFDRVRGRAARRTRRRC